MIRNFLFDFDGTLMDTNGIIRYALRRTVKDVLGRKLGDREFFSVFGKINEDQMNILSPEKSAELRIYYKRLYADKIDEMTRLFPGADIMLKKLKSLGRATAVVSSKNREGILHGLNKFGLTQYIDAIVSVCDVTCAKPEPECVFKAMEMLNAKPDETVVVGDSPYDLLCARNAGVRSALVSWTIFPKESFENIPADFNVRNMGDLSLLAESEM